MSSLLLLLTVSMTTISVIQGYLHCPSDAWSIVGTQCYLAIRYPSPLATDRSWTSARWQCMDMGGDLVSINMPQEDTNVEVIRKYAGIDDASYYWIGLSDAIRERQFTWVDGSDLKDIDARWLQPGEPNSANPTDLAADSEDYVIASGMYMWSDVRNDWNATINGNPEPTGFICEAAAVFTRDVGDKGQRGDQGPEGPIGLMGPQGPEGPEGKPGPQGEQGLPGVNGIQGPDGPRGIQGEQGLPGPQGAQGIEGPLGPTGLQGPLGDKGPEGDPGKPGAEGPAGEPGVTGDEGPRGPRGIQGEQGPQGIAGPQGPDGAPGPEGNKGTPGDKGIKGDTGDKGLSGLNGLKGEKGSRGDFGLPGTPGLPGSRGPHGNQGPPGDAGKRGPTGFRGLDGEPGRHGNKGTKGEKGSMGNPGISGRMGVNGLPGDKGPTGDKGVKGDEGDPGPRGSAGRNGLHGRVGQPGPPGPPGSVPSMLYRHTVDSSTVHPSTPFINVSIYCAGLPAGLYAHPLHCWQFVACGSQYKGDREYSCHSGRKFHHIVKTCVWAPECSYGTPTHRNGSYLAQALHLRARAQHQKGQPDLLKVNKGFSVYTGVTVSLMVVVSILVVLVVRLYVVRARSNQSQLGFSTTTSESDICNTPFSKLHANI